MISSVTAFNKGVNKFIHITESSFLGERVVLAMTLCNCFHASDEILIILGPSNRDCTDIKVEVRRIDYGDVVYISLWDVKELCGEAASKPVQAQQVSLVNVGVSINITLEFIYSF